MAHNKQNLCGQIHLSGSSLGPCEYTVFEKAVSQFPASWIKTTDIVAETIFVLMFLSRMLRKQSLVLFPIFAGCAADIGFEHP